MPQYIALLRAINVGGHTVSMERLRGLFEAEGFSDVETFIASGNVIFKARSRSAPALQETISKFLHGALGYAVAAFIRTPDELAAIARHRPFPPADLAAAAALNIAFLADPLDGPSKRALLAMRTDIDDFHVHGREIYWKCLKKQSESTFSNAALEKAVKRQATLRGLNTIRKLAEKYAPTAR